MRITIITYRRLKNIGNYESEALEATAEVQEDEDIEEAFADLKEWTELKLGISTKHDELF